MAVEVVFQVTKGQVVALDGKILWHQTPKAGLCTIPTIPSEAVFISGSK